GNMEAVLSDYTENSVVYWAGGASRGLAEIEKFAQTFLDSLPEGFWKNAKTLRAEFDGEIGYTLWESTGVPIGTDTYIVRDGKIAVQTFAMYVG
ncbi:MAG: nuclear transport factor 2 family protein, partial [Candidatus Promineifilaceae bacterium]